VEIKPGQLWEMYSAKEKCWVMVVVVKVDGGRVTLRYRGFLEFFTVELLDMQTKPDLFRPAKVT
jgi:hypothetical protein